MSDWQPIETAPRDGTWVLLFEPPQMHNYKGGRVFVATWEPLTYNDEPQWAYGAGGYEHGFRNGVYHATHWMPLPGAPDA